MRRNRDLLAPIEAAALDPASDITDTLRRCVALGGRTGSTALRDWATAELKGYHDASDLPSYRRISAPLVMDAAVPGGMVTGQQVPITLLPEGSLDVAFDDVPLAMSIAEIAGIVTNGRKRAESAVNLGVPGGAALVALMNEKLRADGHTSSPYDQVGRSQQIERVYWSVSLTSMARILDVVRTTLVELVAELRAGMEPGDSLPSHALTDEAVGIAVRGNRNRITINQVTAAEGATVTTSAGNLSSDESETGVRRVVWWAVSVSTFIAGVCGVLALIL